MSVVLEMRGLSLFRPHFWKNAFVDIDAEMLLNPSYTKGGPLRTPEGDFLWSCRNYNN